MRVKKEAFVLFVPKTKFTNRGELNFCPNSSTHPEKKIFFFSQEIQNFISSSRYLVEN